MREVSFLYNTQNARLIMPEYGRTVQDLIWHCKRIEEDGYRQAFAESVIEIMQIMTPYNRNIEENRKRLWHHLFRIAEYDIKVTPPPGCEVTAESDTIHPEKVKYPRINNRNRHYGSYVSDLIKKAVEIEPGQKQDEFAMIIGSFMKLAVKTWNKEHYINDEAVKNELYSMSGGVLQLDPEVSLDSFSANPKFQKRVGQVQMSKLNPNYKQKQGINKNKNKKKKFKKYQPGL
ncbi:MAG: DUF4290 domain-containing protein [Saprospiraceae bacterium]|jgi:hypothetical protein|nr:DUF4290 domain-containing protein [Saprospiraceae bacterium]MBK7795386.1 DUF4290 domain-containing protein [Saprospiraceae bacterium]MBK8153910.1 DUF4290 domain-containing protein [Saprospiraceae bacterium]MBK9379194.1 DUF4290 domain-containing protein [Saprospiraceae bacterium]MBL0260496.1 DUF4290 domain-containing protein [Saprospiraceae bacterium]